VLVLVCALLPFAASASTSKFGGIPWSKQEKAPVIRMHQDYNNIGARELFTEDYITNPDLGKVTVDEQLDQVRLVACVLLCCWH
jgi:hypothetical protein